MFRFTRGLSERRICRYGGMMSVPAKATFYHSFANSARTEFAQRSVRLAGDASALRSSPTKSEKPSKISGKVSVLSTYRLSFRLVGMTDDYDFVIRVSSSLLRKQISDM